MNIDDNIMIQVASEKHASYAEQICMVIAESARIRGTGIARREPAYILEKMKAGKAIIALEGRKLAGFCYIESWGKEKNFVANSGLIVLEEYRKSGLGKRIKKAAFELSRRKFPEAKLFGITTSLAVLRINHALGYRPVHFTQLTDDLEFWEGCKGCVNYPILESTNRTNCLCTAMLYDPEEKKQEAVADGEKKIAV
jgi:GNAT superfamily N-acetyltransferase